MFITELSIKRPAVSWVMSLILIIFGLFVFWKLPVRELPDGIQPPVVQVQIQVRGMDAAAQNHPRPARTGCRVQVFQQHGPCMAMGHT